MHTWPKLGAATLVLAVSLLGAACGDSPTQPSVAAAAQPSAPSADLYESEKDRVIETAKDWINFGYCYPNAAGWGRSCTHCAGLVRHAFLSVGKNWPSDVDWQQRNAGSELSRGAEWHRADLLFYYNPSVNHVGIYLGNGNMIHSRFTGQGDGLQDGVVITGTYLGPNWPLVKRRRPQHPD